METNGNTCSDCRLEMETEEAEEPAKLLKRLSVATATNMDNNNNNNNSIINNNNNNKFTELGISTRGSVAPNDKLEIKIVMLKVQLEKVKSVTT
ncbi:hypothetical protein ACLKA7_009041 [Drosophila subpalustris]